MERIQTPLKGDMKMSEQLAAAKAIKIPHHTTINEAIDKLPQLEEKLSGLLAKIRNEPQGPIQTRDSREGLGLTQTLESSASSIHSHFDACNDLINSIEDSIF